MKVCLDLHDFSITHNRMDYLRAIKAALPGFKVSLFTVPNDLKADYGPYLNRREQLELVKDNLDWIQLIPHGLNHNGAEMLNVNYSQFKNVILPEIKSAFERDGLPYVKGFCAPHWAWNRHVIKALNEEGWWGAVRPDMPHRTARFYQYNYSINELFPLNGEVLKLHGHLYGTANDLEKCFENILRVPQDARWHFVTDFLET